MCFGKSEPFADGSKNRKGTIMFIKTKGIVLRETDYQDRDKLLTVLTADFGKLTVKARGIKGTRNTMKASCQLMAYSELTLMEQKDQFVLTEASSLELFSELQQDIELLALSSYFLQVTDFVAQEEDPCPEILSLLLNTLYALGRLKLPQTIVKSVFELRLSCLLGFRPELGGCCSCGRGAPAYFSLSRGGLLCGDCGNLSQEGEIRLPLSQGTLSAMGYISTSQPGKLFSFRLAPNGLRELSGITEAYLCSRLERGFYTLDFYKSLQIEGIL